jgi:hypothetical protein
VWIKLETLFVPFQSNLKNAKLCSKVSKEREICWFKLKKKYIKEDCVENENCWEIQRILLEVFDFLMGYESYLRRIGTTL